MELMLALIAVELYFVLYLLWCVNGKLKDLNTLMKHLGADTMDIRDEVHMSKMILRIISGEVIKMGKKVETP